MNKLYICTYPKTTRYAEANINPNALFSNQHDLVCPLCRFRSTIGVWQHPMDIELDKSRLPDVLYGYGFNVPFLFSERCVQKLVQSEITGICAFEKVDQIKFAANVINPDAIPNYYLPIFKHSRIVVNHMDSKIIYGSKRSYPKCPLCNPTGKTYDFIRGLNFDMQNYEGYDIFHTYELGFGVFCSEKFVQFFRKNRFTNLSCTRIELYDSAYGILTDEEFDSMQTDSV